MENNSVNYKIADITIQVSSDLPITSGTFADKFLIFKVDQPGKDIVRLHHHFNLIDIGGLDLGEEVYNREPWKIIKQNDGWFYLGILPDESNQKYWKMAKFNQDYSQGDIYHVNSEIWQKGDLDSLTTFPTDQILIAELLPDRQGCYLHSAGAIINGSGFLFVGHSEAGKSTITQMLMDADRRNGDLKDLEIEILCDDRNIIRKWDDGWLVYGSWSHGDIPEISASSAPLRAIFFLDQSKNNMIIPIEDRSKIIPFLLSHVIRPFTTVDWWHKVMDNITHLANNVPCYDLLFDKSGKIVQEICKLKLVS